MGYVFNDLKPDNILLDFRSKSLNELFLVDFGFATKYQDKIGHLKPQVLDVFRGNIMTASVDHMNYQSTSRRDDLKSLFYNALFLLN